MKALIFLFLAVLLPSCSVFQPTVKSAATLPGDTIFISPTIYEGRIYQVGSPESSITLILVNITQGTITGYSYDSDGRHTEFILSYTLSPWYRDNEKVYDTVLGTVRIVEDPVIFLPHSGRISIGGREWMVK